MLMVSGALKVAVPRPAAAETPPLAPGCSRWPAPSRSQARRGQEAGPAERKACRVPAPLNVPTPCPGNCVVATRIPAGSATGPEKESVTGPLRLPAGELRAGLLCCKVGSCAQLSSGSTPAGLQE
ncbi:MAG: hypothetical protein WKG07_34890 [Hymenobacter sp.]